MVTVLTLEEALQKYEFCAGMEVTNGVYVNEIINGVPRGNRFEKKISQAKRIEELFDKVETIGGIIVFRNPNIDFLKENLSHVYELEKYELSRTKETLERLKQDEKLYEHSGAILDYFIDYVNNNGEITDLFYPTNWEGFQQNYPKLIKLTQEDFQEYHRLIGNIKGKFLEDQTASYCEEIQNTHVYRSEETSKGEIDLIIVGEKENILEGLNKIFIRHK